MNCRLLLLAALALLSGPCLVRAADDFSFLDRAYVEGGVQAGSGGTFGGTTLFAPLWDTDDAMVYTDLRGIGGNSQTFGNFGGGIRHWNAADVIFGGYAFYDRTRYFGQSYQQVMLGYEFLTIDWDARINFYAPRSKLSQQYSTAFLNNGTVQVGGLTQTPFYGSDTEAGYLINDWNDGGVELRGYVGAYWFDSRIKNFDAIIGTRLRAELRLFDLPWLGNGSRLVAAGLAQWDRFYGTQGQAQLTLRIPLQFRRSRKLDRFERRKLNPIYRRQGVFVEDVWTVEQADFPDGRPISAAATIDHDTPAPQDVVARLGKNSVVIVDGTAGPINLREPLAMSNGQAILGGGTSLRVVGHATGGRAWFTAPGERPEIVQRDPFKNAIELPKRNGTVGGVDVFSPRYAIYGETTTGTRLAWNAAGRVSSNRYARGGVGVLLRGDQTDANISHNVFDGNGYGLYVDGSVSGTIAYNLVTDNHKTGIDVEGDLLADLTGNAVRNDANRDDGVGIDVKGRAVGDIRDNLIESNTHDGLRIGGEMIGEFSGNEANSNGASGFHFVGPVQGAIFDNTAKGNGVYGFEFSEVVSGRISGNVATENGSNGLYAAKGTADVIDNLFYQNGRLRYLRSNQGLRIDGPTTGVVRNNDSLK